MSPLPMEAWCMIAMVAAGAMLAMLHALAAYFREQTKVHDLRVRVHELRKQYKKRLAADNSNVVALEAEPAPAEAAKQAA